MKTKDKKEVTERIELEGFDYTFAHYSSFDEIKDNEFHKLRSEFLDARQKLVNYLGVEDV